MTSCGSKQSNSQHEEEELIEVVEENKVVCPDCEGTQYCLYTCPTCNGTGKNTVYLSGTRPKTCTSCDGTGKELCKKCDGYGFIECPYCDSGYDRCTVCKGRGSILLGNEIMTCPKCDGSGVLRCDFCVKGRMKCSCNNGFDICEECWGSGYSGQENYSDIKQIECESCNGSGSYQDICDRCEGEGWIIETQIVTKRKSEL